MDSHAGFDEAASQLLEAKTAPVIGFNLTSRDWSQSLTNNRIALDHPLVLEIYGLVNEFNRAGPVKFTSVEHGGAQLQNDILCGRDPLQSFQNIDATLDKKTEVRILVRGPYGVGLEALHPDDLTVVLESMAEAAGAKTGRPVVFKLFEAQNVPDEYVSTLRILSKLKKQGYNVACEAAVCFTADEAFGEAYYLKAARKITVLAAKVDPALLRRVTFKDMTGYATDATDRIEEGSSTAMARILNKVAQEYHAHTGIIVETGVHSHNNGLAEKANSTASKTSKQSAQSADGFAVPSAFVIDVMPGRSAFADAREVMMRNAEQGVGPAPSQQQLSLLRDMENIVQRLERVYAYTMISNASVWTDAQVCHARLPLGAKVDAFQKAVLPVAKILQEKTGMKEAEAIQSVADLFPHVNRWLAHQNGNANSVTPGAKNLYSLARVVLGAVVESGHYQELVNNGVDFRELKRVDRRTGKKTEVKWVSELWQHVGALAQNQDKEVVAAKEYFRSRMPVKSNEGLLAIYSRNHLEKLLGEKEIASTLAFIPEDKRDEVKESLLAHPTNKSLAYKTLTEAGGSTATVTAFIREHVGFVELLRDENRPSVLNNVDAFIAKLKETAPYHKIKISDRSARFALINMGGAGKDQFSSDAVRLCTQGTSDQNAAAWVTNFVDWWKLTRRWTAKASGDAGLTLDLGKGVTDFLRGIRDPALRGKREKEARKAVIAAARDIYPELGLTQSVGIYTTSHGALPLDISYLTQSQKQGMARLSQQLGEVKCFSVEPPQRQQLDSSKFLRRPLAGRAAKLAQG